MIDNYIEQVASIESKNRGLNKECFVFNNYVLLRGSSVDKHEKAINKIKVMNELKKDGVNLARLLEYKRIGNKDYELQEKAPGDELYKIKMCDSTEGQRHFLERLKNISMESSEFYDNFVKDWNKIIQSGLDVDPSKSSNFFYQKGKICFIDLNFSEVSLERREEFKYIEMAIVLRGGGLPWMCNLVEEEAIKLTEIIYKKLGEAIVRVNGNINQYIEQIDPQNKYKLAEYFSYSNNQRGK